MKKQFNLLILSMISALLFALFSPMQDVSAASGTTISKATYQTLYALNLRSSTTTSSKKLLTIPKGKKVSSNYRSGNWYKVTYSGKTGYVLGTYLKKIATTSKEKTIVKASTVNSKGTTFTNTTYTTLDSLNLRSSASLDGKKLLTIPKGKKVSSNYRSGNWYKVTYNGKTGYVLSTYLKKVTSTSKGTTFTKTTYTTLDSLNLRSSASVSGKKLLSIPKGKNVSSNYRIGNWYKVTYNGKTGYVSGSYLKKSSPNSTSASLPASNTVDYTGSKMYVLVPFKTTVTLRSGASSLSSSIGTLPRGTAVTVSNSLHKTRGFVAVRTADGRFGYIESTYLTLFQPSMSARPLVVLDPGHGGHDVGAARYGIYERDIVMSVAKLVASRLSGKVDLKLTRYTNDYYPSLPERSLISNAHKTNLFVSIHINAATSNDAYGAENFYYRGVSSVNLANQLQRNLVNTIGLRDRGIKFGNLSVLRNTNAPAVLTELGFLSNSSDRAKLMSSYYQDKYADAVANSILSSL